MHGKSIAWVRDRCRLEGAYRPLLYAVATLADKHFAQCNASAYTLARASGLSPRWVKKLLPELVEMGVLDRLFEGQGRKPACYGITPSLWVEGAAGGSGIVEGQAEASDVIEGSVSGAPYPSEGVSTGSASGEPSAPQGNSGNGSRPRSGELGDPVVVHSLIRSGELGAGPYKEEDKNLEEKNEEEKSVPRSSSLAQNASSHAGRPQAADAPYTPPEVDEATREHLRRRGLGQKHPPATVRPLAPPSAPTMDRDRQLAELRRRHPAEFAEQERQEREGATPHVQAHADVATGNGVANPATVEIKVGMGQAQVRVDAHAGGKVVQVATAGEVEAAGQVKVVAERGRGAERLRVVNE